MQPYVQASLAEKNINLHKQKITVGFPVGVGEHSCFALLVLHTLQAWSPKLLNSTEKR